MAARSSMPVVALAISAAFGAAAAQEFKENPLTHGAWAFPSEKISPATVARFCAAGFSFYFNDGSFFSVLNEPAGRRRTRISVDTVGTCIFDPSTQTATCTGEEMERGKSFPLKDQLKFERDGDAIKITSTVKDRQSREQQTVVTYAMRCPDRIVRDILSKGIPPK
jgi:hypothetical protein